jgi:hypothetical protein
MSSNAVIIDDGIEAKLTSVINDALVMDESADDSMYNKSTLGVLQSPNRGSRIILDRSTSSENYTESDDILKSNYFKDKIMMCRTLCKTIKLIPKQVIQSWKLLLTYESIDSYVSLDPVNFNRLRCVSHNWTTRIHPDPSGEKLNILKDLINDDQEDILIFLDYCSLPQGDDFESIMTRNMGLFVFTYGLNNRCYFIIGKGFYQKMWCLYEWIVAQITGADVKHHGEWIDSALIRPLRNKSISNFNVKLICGLLMGSSVKLNSDTGYLISNLKLLMDIHSVKFRNSDLDD